MSKFGRYLRKTQTGYVHWCPACEGVHSYTTEERQTNGARWFFDGNVEAPTFTPSMKITWGKMADPKGDWPEGGCCHYFVTNGQIKFCDDSTHDMRGKTVPLPDWPYSPGTYGGIEE